MSHQSSFADMTLGEFGAALASAQPVPGGGSASAICASLAAGLAVMVARLSVDRPRYAAYSRTHAQAIDLGDRARVRFLELADEDARAYGTFAAARRLPRESDAEQSARTAALRDAARVAAEVPLEAVRECRRTVHLVERLAGRSNLNAASDLDVAALLVTAAAQGAAENVRVNLPVLDDDAYVARVSTELEDLLEDIRSTAARIPLLVRSGALRDPEEA